MQPSGPMEHGNTQGPAPSAAFGGLETAEALAPEQIEARARALLAALTPDEKLGLMTGDADFWPGLAQMTEGGYGARPYTAGAVPRLGIPGIRFTDGPRGVVLPGATTFPVSMARGATWDPELEERVGEAMGREARALGANLLGAVCVNLLRHPAWGRAQETYGEDPAHVGAMGAALARGIQRHVMACVKHYALNSMEDTRFKVDVTADARTLHEVYLPHFKRVVEAGVAAVMSAYNSVNGQWCGQNAPLLTDILKGAWGFDGFVVTDWIFGLRDARTAALAGQDLEMPFRMHFARELPGLVARGEVPQGRVDDAALRLLRQQVRFAQGRDPAAYGPDVVGGAAHRALAREVARKGMVLLKNEGGLLPLAGVGRLAVIGRLADAPNTGDAGSSETRPAHVVTPLEGLRAALGDGTRISVDDGADPARVAAVAGAADVALVVVGLTAADEGELISSHLDATLLGLFPPPRAEDEPIVQRLAQVQMAQMAAGAAPTARGGDRRALTLHAEDEALIAAVAAANPRTVVALMGGGALITEAWRARVPAILMLWYPGMEGGHALADVLLGRAEPGGRLPCSFAARAEDLPAFDADATAVTYDLWHGYRKLERDGAAPAYPFGFGLGYTTFAFADLRLGSAELGPGDALEATVTVRNTGARAGEAVAQLYVAARGSRVERPARELKAFARVALAPGEAHVARLAVPAAELAYYDAAAGWTVEAIEYEAMVGRHAADAEAPRARFRVR